MGLNIDIVPGKYVLAVSGGVDSMVLLDLLSKKAGALELIVAHFNHGIRPESDKDEEFVRSSAKRLGLSFEVGYGDLGKNASEEKSRDARYSFLSDIQKKHKAKSIITAHHQDDLIETAVINVMRGTGRKGITAIADNKLVTRPLLGISKAQILEYADINNIIWREDESNQEEKYLRNLIRNKLHIYLTPSNREKLITNYDKVAKNNNKLNQIIAIISQEIIDKDKINRDEYISLPHDVGKEVVMWWLNSLDITKFDRKQIERLDMALRTAKSSTKHPITKDYWLIIGTDEASIATSN